MNKQLMQELLIETIGFYDTEKRSAGIYSCAYESSNGNRCAVGRIMTDEAIKKVREAHNMECGSDELIDLYGRDILLEKWRPIVDNTEGRLFLSYMQLLHDYPGYWTNKGLSLTGEDVVRRTAKRFDLDLPTIFAAIEKRANS